jgi:uncharacterized protein (UPF0335 family)
MWKQLADLGSKLFTLMRRVEKLEEDSKGLHQDVKDLNQKVDQLTDIVQRLAFEFQRDRENAERDRVIQQLRLENLLLRFERGLPPGSKPENEDES